MNKSMIISLVAIWLICTMYLPIAKSNGLPFAGAAFAGSLIATTLLIICIFLFIRNNNR